MGKILILGLGNDILSDDAVGPNLTKYLESQLDESSIQFKTSAVGGMDIIDLIKESDHAIIIDSIKSEKGIPGEIYHFKPDKFQETLHLSNFHDLDFQSALELAKQTGIRMPETIDVIAIEIVEDLVFSDNYSPEINEKFMDISKRVIDIVSKLIC